MEKESHLLELCRYLVLNPVRAKMVERPEQYHWSSYLPTLGAAAVPLFLTTAWVLGNFSTSRPEACRRYRHFVEEGMTLSESPWEKLSGQVLLGSEGFVNRVRELLGGKQDVPEIPRVQRFVGRPLLEELFPSAVMRSKQERNRLICLAHGNYGYTLKEISQVLGVHYTTVSKVINGRER